MAHWTLNKKFKVISVISQSPVVVFFARGIQFFSQTPFRIKDKTKVDCQIVIEPHSDRSQMELGSLLGNRLKWKVLTTTRT
jgi:hypothetical protein